MDLSLNERKILFLQTCVLVDFNVIIQRDSLKEIKNFITDILHCDYKMDFLKGNIHGSIYLRTVNDEVLFYIIKHISGEGTFLYLLNDKKTEEFKELTNPTYNPEDDCINIDNMPFC